MKNHQNNEKNQAFYDKKLRVVYLYSLVLELFICYNFFMCKDVSRKNNK